MRSRRRSGPASPWSSRTLDDKRWVVVGRPARARLVLPTSTTATAASVTQAVLDQRPQLEGGGAGEDDAGRDQVPRDGLDLVELPHARRPTGRDGRRGRCRWCSTSTAARGRATPGASTRSTSGSPTAATPCCSVNYRGSTGFGKEFVNAGDREWAGKMHDDLIDAVDWAVEQKHRRRRTRSPSWAAATAATRRSSA